MAMFFMRLEVAPGQGNKQAELVAGAFAYCWITGDSAAAAFNTARFYITKDAWRIAEVVMSPTEISEQDCSELELGLEQYHKAQQQGIAIVYMGWARDGKTSAGPIPLEPSVDFDLNAYIQRKKKLADTGRCLHFESGARCE
jgi:hypothetical protein